MVNISVAMGGMAGVIAKLQGLARGPRSTQVVTALMGFFVFFDDYANTVVVGGAARPLTDSHRISRAKLAYLVDSTAAPIAGIAIVSTWIGIEINYFQGALDQIGPPLNAVADGGYDFFFQSLPYRFYCFFALALVFLVAMTGRDFGPMVAAERWARERGSKTPEQADDPRLKEARESVAHVRVKDGAPPRWQNGVLPIFVVIICVVMGSIQSGSEAMIAAGNSFDWTDMGHLGTAFTKVQDSVQVLFIAALFGTFTAACLAVFQKILTVRETASSFTRGAIAMLPAIWILILAMAIRTVAKDLQAAHFLAALLGDVSPLWLPLVSFLVAGGVAFATGTSWGTMAILVPVCLPLTAELAAGMPEAPLLLFLVGASVLDGAIFGDHCSLISDTTVMSSIATGCEHVEHVRTQIPYATLAMLVAASAGYGLTAWLGGEFFWVSYPVGAMLMLIWLWVRGTSIETPSAVKS
jgi:Na+/H+ antiporter NhaC